MDLCLRGKSNLPLNFYLMAFRGSGFVPDIVTGNVSAGVSLQPQFSDGLYSSRDFIMSRKTYVLCGTIAIAPRRIEKDVVH